MLYECLEIARLHPVCRRGLTEEECRENELPFDATFKGKLVPWVVRVWEEQRAIDILACPSKRFGPTDLTALPNILERFFFRDGLTPTDLP